MSGESRDKPDYYDILGVVRDASPEDIRTAFYALARQHHPDMAPGVDPSNQQFKAILEAYEVLSDPLQRREYDRRRRSRVRVTVRPTSKSAQPTAQTSSPPGVAGTRSGEDVYADLPVSPEEARFGAACPVRVRWQSPCRVCGGTGAVQAEPCHHCQARGVETWTRPFTIQVPPGVRTGSVLCIEVDTDRPRELGSRTERRQRRLYLRVVIHPCW